MPSIVSIRDAQKEYHLGKVIVPALRGVSIEVEEGDFLAIAGPSGSGKTTLLNLIGCVDTPTSGVVRVAGRDIAQLSERELTRLRLETIGFIFQSFNLVNVLNVFRNVELPLLLQRKYSASERKTRVLELLGRVGISDFVRHRPNELSGGQRQRVAIARALVTRPKLVLADEPTANLDSVTGQNILDLMKELNRTEKTTFIFSTHDARVMAHASHIIRLADGKLAVEAGNARENDSGAHAIGSGERLMRGLFDTLEVAVQIALRNLLANRWKTLIVGGIIAFGACLVVVGTSLLDAVDRAMSRSIVGSVAGNIQVYSSKSKDELAIMGGFNADAADIAPIPDFAKVRATLLKVPNVAAVVPMGISGALVTSGNSVDQVLAHLRESTERLREGDLSLETRRRYDAQKGHIKQIVAVLQHDLENVRRVNSERVFGDEELEAVRTGASETFWSSFDADPFEHLEFLENRIANLATDADMLFLRYVGTDPTEFAKHFDRMTIVDGRAIPPGQRGFLFSKYTYEEQVKLKTARGLDKIKEARDARHLLIATDLDLQRVVRENSTGVRELLLQLDAIKSELFRQKLQRFLGSQQTDLGALLAAFFKTDDGNFDARYRFFYAELAPELELYRVRIGDTLTIKAFTRSGYVQSANLKVYGTYDFKGLERSPQAGSLNMMDLVSFRELYGFMTVEREREIAAMRASAGVKEIDRDKAEAELFGSAPPADADTNSDTPNAKADAAMPTATEAPVDELASLKGTSKRDQQPSAYDPTQLEQGVVLNVAVLVRDDQKLPETMLAIEDAGRKHGLPLKAISWQKAAGIIGQFATLMRAVLYATVVIIFVVALVVINNALVMATLERVHEFGTLRAIGAQRRFVLAMLVVESLVVGVLSGTFGALLGAAVLLVLGKIGIPAVNDVLTFFFSGPRLFPTVGAPALLFALTTVLIVSIISGFYPAWIAMRVSPREAMSASEE